MVTVVSWVFVINILIVSSVVGAFLGVKVFQRVVRTLLCVFRWLLLCSQALIQNIFKKLS